MAERHRPSRARLVAGQIRYALTSYVRSPVLAFVTLGFPLLFLAVTSLAVRGIDVLPDGRDAQQVVAASATVFAAATAAFVMLPFTVAMAREQGIVKRLRGSPLPLWTYMTGRIAAAVAVGIAGTALLLGVGSAAFDVEVVWRALPGLVAILVVGSASFAAIGFALLAFVRSSQAVMAVTMGSLMITAFVSEMFAPATAMPGWLDTIGWVLPLRHFAAATSATFDLAAPALAISWDHIAVLAIWGAVGAGTSLALHALDLRPSSGRVRRRTARTEPGGGDARPRPAGSLVRMVREQARHADRSVWRDPGSAFFAVGFPILFVVVAPTAFGDPVIDGVPFSTSITLSMIVFALSVTAYLNTPESVAIQRDRGVLKRLRATPLPGWTYVAGRMISVVRVTAVSVLAVLGTGMLLHGVAVPARAAMPLTIAVLLGTVAMGALGLALAALVRDAASVPAVALATFLPLAFVSDVFTFGVELPQAVQRVAAVFPLRHIMTTVESAYADGAFALAGLAVVAAWGVVGSTVAVARFRWNPRTDPAG